MLLEFSTMFDWNFAYLEKKRRFIVIAANIPLIEYPTLLSEFKRSDFSPRSLWEIFNIKFHDMSPCGVRIAAIRKTETTEQILQHCNIAKGPKIWFCIIVSFTVPAWDYWSLLLIRKREVLFKSIFSYYP